ncbi:MAG: hypothetical protein KF774_03720 [Planctomyces sp.]|nr:hypothetical protein [Planctomyces sp.]
MWCSQCQADVATELAADGKHLLCTICGEEVRKAFAPSQHPETQSARELLDRWAKSDFLESYSALLDSQAAEEIAESTSTDPADLSTPAATVVPQPAVARDQPAAADGGADLLPSPKAGDPASERPVRKIHRGARSSSPRPAAQPPADAAKTTTPTTAAPAVNWRFDTAHEESQRSAHAPASRPHIDNPAAKQPQQASASSTPAWRDDASHSAAPAPHFDLEVFAAQSGRRPGRQESVFGQLLAYVGVGLLTIGTALVVWGYFGGAAVQKYQSTGWLISTAGQMLLFLGVVTLVSGGMQQTTHEVSQRVDYIGNRMLRIEQSTQELLKGPYFAKSGAAERATVRDDSRPAA